VGALRLVSPFASLTAAELAELARVMQPLERAAGEVLWREGDPADGLHVIVDGSVTVSLRQPGGGRIELATVGPGNALGEVALLDGGTRSAGAHAARPVRLLFLSRADFGALTSRRHPMAFAVRRRICVDECSRLRTSYLELADSLGPASAGSDPPAQLPTAPTATVPPSDYLLRLEFLSGLDEGDLDELLASSRLVLVPRGRVLVREGDTPQACFVTLNGAVEEVIERSGARIPVGLAGPGRAFGYLGLIDGLHSPLTARARERALLLAIPPSVFDEYFRGPGTSLSYAMFGSIERDLMAALRRKDVGFVRAVRRGMMAPHVARPRPVPQLQHG
jgi:CRP-like cAMP-binding protein